VAGKSEKPKCEAHASNECAAIETKSQIAAKKRKRAKTALARGF
jgi:hypothetical protein